MNKSYLSAAILSFLAAIVRTIDGHTGPLQVARESAMETTAVAFFHLTWHMVTVFMIAAAIALLFLAMPKQALQSAQLGRFIGIVFLAWSALIATVSFWSVWHAGTVIPMIVTFLIGVLALVGTRNTTRRA